MPLRTLVDATDLSQWADRRDAQARLPQLLRRLIHATVDRTKRIGFRTGEGVQLGGWDGIVIVEQGNAFVPDEQSVWELGANRKVEDKADDDYEKRKADPLGIDPAATTFVFVTPRRWNLKEEWIKERQAEGFWRDVRAYDADNLELWLELAPAVHIWLSIMLGTHPEGVVDLSSFWADWSEATSPPLDPRLLTGSRQEQVEQLQAWLTGEPASLALKADSRQEAVAFLAAVLHQLPPEEHLPLLARCVVVADSSAWHHLVASERALLLVPTFEIGDAVVRAVRGGHHVLIPLGMDDSKSETTVQLPRLRRSHAVEALLGMGLSEERAHDLATLARRSLMALRRKLAITPEVQRPAWAQPAEARSLLPALLAGSWNDSQAGDREVIKRLAGVPYANVSATLTRWANEPDPPVRRVGDTWLLASKEDAWTLLARFLTRDDLDLFENVMLDVLGTPDPQFDLPNDQRWVAGLLGRSPTCSGLLREGLAHTVALMGTRSDSTQFAAAASGQERASRIVRHLLGPANEDWRRWASLAYLLPLLAEAAPEEFLAAVEAGIAGEQPVLTRLFQDTTRSLFSSSPHTGLLWALERLAWSQDHLPRVSLLLARLAVLDPGGTLSNRPDSSLRGIFLCWYPQTTANLDQRLRVIDLLRSREPQVAWRLMCKLLPEAHGIAHPATPPRWREWVPDAQLKVTHAEFCEATSQLVDRLLIDVGNDGQRWGNLIERVGSMPKEQRDMLNDRLLEIDVEDFSREAQLAVRGALRAMISRHRKFPNAEWVLPAEVVDRLESVYEHFEPDDPIDRYAWLFSNTPKLLEPSGHDWQSDRRALVTARLEAAQAIHAAGGVPLLLKIATHVEQPGEFGMTLGDSNLIGNDEDELLSQHLSPEDSPYALLTRGYVVGRWGSRGWQWAEDKLAGVVATDMSPVQQAAFLGCLPFESRSWDMLARLHEESRYLYWSRIRPWGVAAADCERAATLLLEHGRPYAAVDLVDRWVDKIEADLPPMLLADLLEQVVRTAPERGVDLQSLPYNISKLLDHIELSGEIEEERIASLEWAALPLLERHYRGPKILHRELARNPGLFVEALSLVYRAENEEPRDAVEENEIHARRASDLLRTWRLIPGTQEDGTIDPAALRTWVAKARTAAQALGRSKIGDQCIGAVLAYSAKDADGSWPAAAVRDIIEEVSNEDLDIGFEVQVHNSRGVVSRALTEGGSQEWQLVETYLAYADRVKECWPRTAAVLRQIASWYVSQARREDMKAELEEDLW